MKTPQNITRCRLSSPVLSIVLLVCSAVWWVGACRWWTTSAFKVDWSATPLLWTLTLMVTPSICFSIGIILADTRQRSRLSRLDWFALVAALFPVTLGSALAVWAVKALFGASFQDASAGLKITGALAFLALVAISGSMIWKTARNFLSSKRTDEREVVS